MGPISPVLIISIVVTVILIALIVVIYIYGDKMQKKQQDQRLQMKEAAQPMTMLIIDKKYVKIKDANLPKIVMDNTPKRYRNAKVPAVKAKVGPQIMTLIADDDIFDSLPTKGEVKAMVSGIYIVGVKNIRGKHVEVDTKKKKGLGAKMREKQKEYRAQLDAENEKKISEKEKAKRKKSADRAAKITDKMN